MKCPNCNGTGNIANGMWLCCECEGTGYIEDEMPQKMLTNEEWFCSLSTEEKADLLAELVWWIHPSVQGGRKVELTKESFLRWLKEKHHE